MSNPSRKIKIGLVEYTYIQNDRDKSYSFKVNDSQFRFKTWTWGEKTRVTSECARFNPTTNEFEVDTIAFSQKMLAETLVESNINGKKVNPTLDTIRNFNASLGDQLLQIAQWIDSVHTTGNEDSTAKAGGNGDFELRLNGDVFKFKMWTWGEKNDATGRSIKFDSESGRMKIDLQSFNESLLLATLKEIQMDGKTVMPDTDILRNLDAATGDRLVQIAQEVNNISESEKKTSKQP